MSKLLEIKDLSIAFLKDREVNTVVQNVSFTINRGQTVALVGESGSGKSVTALSILKLLNPDNVRYLSGQINVHTSENQVINTLTAPFNTLRQLRGGKIGMIFQEPMSSLNPVYTCGFQVFEAIKLHKNVSNKAAYNQVLALFDKVKLPNPEQIYKSYPHQLSGGQKQRVMIAMALSCNPELLIADEPTTALDVTVQQSIIELLHSLKTERNLSLLFITHDLGLVKKIADDVLVMNAGQVIESGSVDELFNRPVHPYTQALLACRPGLTLPITKLPTISDFSPAIPFQVTLSKFIEKYPKIHFTKLESKPAILKVKDVTVVFPQKGRSKFFSLKQHPPFIALNRVNLELFEGDVLGVVGESGSGKTTLGRAIVKLVPISAGLIQYNSLEINKLTENQFRPTRPQIQMVFQDPFSALNPYFTVGQAIAEPILYHRFAQTKREARQKAEYLLEQVSLPAKLYNRYPNELSGGQRQRVCIARALALNPKILICDESVSALDVSVQAGILNLLNELKEFYKLSIIFISHDLSVVKFLCNRVLVMKLGQVVETGLTETVYTNPQHEYTQQLIKALN